MTDKEILKRVIEIALDNGWKAEIISKRYGKDEPISSINYAVKDLPKHMDLLIGNFIVNPMMLFSHEFAKAFWGDDIMTIEKVNVGDIVLQAGHELNFVVWQYHLQQMVLEENPIQYLKQFI